MKAKNSFVQIATNTEKSGGFQTAEGNIIEGKVVSIGADVKYFKIGERVIFDTNKSLQHSIDGKKYYFVDYKTILTGDK